MLRERLLTRGAATLSDTELLSILWGTGGKAVPLSALAETVTQRGGGLRAFVRQDPHELCRLPGVGRTRAAQILSALELGRRIQQCPDARPRLRTPAELFQYLHPLLSTLRREVFHVLCFNSRNVLLADVRVGEGTVDACPVDPREVFAPALTHRASAVILAHNHPSGDPEPSAHDIALTAQLVEGGRVLGVRVLDHLVIGDSRFCSMLEQGRMPLASGRPRGGAPWNA